MFVTIRQMPDLHTFIVTLEPLK